MDWPLDLSVTKEIHDKTWKLWQKQAHNASVFLRSFQFFIFQMNIRIDIFVIVIWSFVRIRFNIVFCKLNKFFCSVLRSMGKNLFNTKTFNRTSTTTMHNEKKGQRTIRDERLTRWNIDCIGPLLFFPFHNIIQVNNRIIVWWMVRSGYTCTSKYMLQQDFSNVQHVHFEREMKTNLRLDYIK